MMEVTLLLEDPGFLVFLAFLVFWFSGFYGFSGLSGLGPFFMRLLVFWIFWFFWFGAFPPQDLGFFHFHRMLVFPLPEDHVFLRFSTVFELFLAWGGSGGGGVPYIYIYVCILT